MSTLLKAVDILVLPSLREGMPMVVLEAMGAGIPVIATKVGGTPEVVDDGETGILVPPANVEALREAIVRLVTDKELAEIMGRAGYEYAKEYFSLANMVQGTEEIYKQVAGDPLRRA